MTKKVVINESFGGFSLSEAAVMLYAKKAGINIVVDRENSSSICTDYYKDEIREENYFLDGNIARDDPHLVEVVEELGNEADGNFAELKIVEIPSDVDFVIEEYDGSEWIAEVHRTWS